jgi:hypothetical protein
MSTKLDQPGDLASRREALQLGAALGATLAGGGLLGVAVDAAAGAARHQVSFRMTSKQAKAFTRKIQKDNAFRSRLEKNPRRVLAQNGIDVPRLFLPDQVTLPSKAKLRKSFEGLTKLVGGHPNTEPGLFCLFLVWIIFVLAAIIVESQ